MTTELEDFSSLATNFAIHPRLSQLGQAFFDAQIATILGPQLLSIFWDVRTLTLWREYHQVEHTQPSIEHVEYCQTLNWRCQYQALALPFELRYSQNPTQEPCRITLLIVCHTSNPVYRPDSLLYRNSAARLQSALERPVLQSLREHAPNMLLWILLLGAAITEGQPECRWFLGELAICFWGVKSVDWVGVEDVVRRFLYIERIWRQRFERIWNNVLALSMSSRCPAAV
jgi:hypothetical protein